MLIKNLEEFKLFLKYKKINFLEREEIMLIDYRDLIKKKELTFPIDSEVMINQAKGMMSYKKGLFLTKRKNKGSLYYKIYKFSNVFSTSYRTISGKLKSEKEYYFKKELKYDIDNLKNTLTIHIIDKFVSEFNNKKFEKINYIELSETSIKINGDILITEEELELLFNIFKKETEVSLFVTRNYLDLDENFYLNKCGTLKIFDNLNKKLYIDNYSNVKSYENFRKKLCLCNRKFTNGLYLNKLNATGTDFDGKIEKYFYTGEDKKNIKEAIYFFTEDLNKETNIERNRLEIRSAAKPVSIFLQTITDNIFIFKETAWTDKHEKINFFYFYNITKNKLITKIVTKKDIKEIIEEIKKLKTNNKRDYEEIEEKIKKIKFKSLL